MAELATLVLAFHLVWIAFIIFGALITRGRKALATVHILALLWGIAVEMGPWPCPLTLAENYFEMKAGIEPFQGGFMLHYLDALVYPGVPGWALTCVGMAVCGLNLAIYSRRIVKALARRRATY